MLLRHSHTSPYVRKVTVLLHETGLFDQIDIETVDGWSEPESLIADNPLSMVPTLVLDDGQSLFDSPVICEYLDRCHVARRMIPPTGEMHWRVLRDQALADGILDSAVLIFMELHRRPETLRWDWWLELKRRAIQRALDGCERNIAELLDRVDLGAISIAVALGYLDLRGAIGEWRATCPALAEWYEVFRQRPSMVATAPPG
ncbi:glutathione S-transferase N-terminal domain-containing protein [Thiocystis violascens]|uniref:Glutathione S-transferase n=1 Tax=Thiocystis violascens (strain ATCC 17096 / DSM 198 / 6111) TaxID=765911 RepID=I3YA95_THIV6|nr:glutathione S-transferase N-terminal domain-containing protein [Thiocystis violascens]AFL73913.1 glutathione S-transferase [Thiocystis violascens DSM 198]